MDAIRGQDHAVAQLQAMLEAGRMPHALIFHGPAGVGKFTAAVALSKLLLCHDLQHDLTGRPMACDACASCRMMHDDGAAHPDLHVIRKELATTSSIAELRRKKQTNIPIDLLREYMVGGRTGDGSFHEASAYRTSQLRHGKVFVIDEAELIDAPGQNVLLKTLEEPPDDTYIALVTSDEQRLLPTIRSRGRRIGFRPLPDDVVATWIDQQDVELDEMTKKKLVAFADGSIGRASLAIAFDLVVWMDELAAGLGQMEKQRYPDALGGRMSELINQLAERWVKQHTNASKDAANRMAAGLMWSLVARYARRRIEAAARQQEGAEPDVAERALEPWLGVIDAVRGAETEVRRNVMLNIVTDHLVSRVYRAINAVPVA